MKYFLMILVVMTLLSCTERSKRTQDNNENQRESVDEFSVNRLIRTWYVKQILVNGKEDLENFPVNNDELILNADMTYKSIDKTYDLKQTGAWSFSKPDKIIIETEEESVIFQIVKLTVTELETKMVTDEIDMVIKYKSIE